MSSNPTHVQTYTTRTHLRGGRSDIRLLIGAWFVFTLAISFVLTVALSADRARASETPNERACRIHDDSVRASGQGGYSCGI